VKKFVAMLLLCSFLVAGVVGCGGDTDKDKKKDKDTTKEAKKDAK